jgi:hypothetical protein
MAQIMTFSPTGTRISASPGVSIAGIATETVLFTDNIKSGSLVEGKYYGFRIDLAITTPLVNLSALTFKIKYGTQTFTMMAGTPLIANLTLSPVTIQGYLVSRGPNNQFITGTIVQPSGSVINLSFTNSSMRGTMTIDSTVDQDFLITAQITGAGVGSTSVIVDWVLRTDF